MHIITRSAVAVVVIGGLALGSALPAQAAAPAPASASAVAHSAPAKGRVALPAASRVDQSTHPFTVVGTQLASSAGTLKNITFTGTAEPGSYVTITYTLKPGTKSVTTRGFAGLVRADAQGRWRIAGADFSNALVEKDGRVQYNPVQTDEQFTELARYIGYLPVR